MKFFILQLVGPHLDHFMTLILMLMGSPERVKNPHLRAHLAEMLESLMPEEERNSSLISGYESIKLHKFKLVPYTLKYFFIVFLFVNLVYQSVLKTTAVSF